MVRMAAWVMLVPGPRSRQVVAATGEDFEAYRSCRRHGDRNATILSDGYDGLVILLNDGVFQIDIRNTVPQLREFLQILHSRFTIIMPKP